MDQKKLRPQVAQRVSHITIQDLPTELVELSENDLQSLVGGIGIDRWYDNYPYPSTHALPYGHNNFGRRREEV